MIMFTATLKNMITYTLPVIAGILFNRIPAIRVHPLHWLDSIQKAILILLIVSLGIRLGANPQIISSLGEIGSISLIVAVSALTGSLLVVTLLRRFVLKLDRYGLPKGNQENSEQYSSIEAAGSSMTWLIIGAVLLGMAGGVFFAPPFVTEACVYVTDYGLRLMLFLIGLEMGRNGSVLLQIQEAGPAAILIPAGITVGTLLSCVISGLFLPGGVKAAAAVSAGFGWYSLTPSLIAEYDLQLSAVAFLSNVMREIISIALIPFVAKNVGYVECVALPGAAAMDSSLPVIVAATHQRLAIYSFASGVILSLLVPVLVPLILSL